MQTPTVGKRPSYYAFPGLIRVGWSDLGEDDQIRFIMRTVIDTFSKKFDDKMDKVYTNTRIQRYVNARMIFYYLAKKHIKRVTFKRLAREFEQDHSTAMHACDMMENFIHTKDELVYDLYNEIEKTLKYE